MNIIDKSVVISPAPVITDNGISTGRGDGWLIGDGIALASGHVVYEWNRDRDNPDIVTQTTAGGLNLLLELNSVSQDLQTTDLKL